MPIQVTEASAAMQRYITKQMLKQFNSPSVFFNQNSLFADRAQCAIFHGDWDAYEAICDRLSDRMLEREILAPGSSDELDFDWPLEREKAQHENRMNELTIHAIAGFLCLLGVICFMIELQQVY